MKSIKQKLVDNGKFKTYKEAQNALKNTVSVGPQIERLFASEPKTQKAKKKNP